MKARLTFALLSAAIIALLGVSAWFTMSIFDTKIDDAAFSPVQPEAPDTISITHEESVTLQTTVRKDQTPVRRPAAPITPERKAPKKPAKTAPMPDYAGTVAQITGEAFRNKTSGVRAKLTASDKIFLNDNIETGPKSRLVIAFIDNTRLSLGEKTTCIIDEYAYDSTAQSESGFAMRLVHGACRVVTGFITDLNPERFKVETRMATIGIRGCELGFSSQQEEENVFILGLGSDEAVVVSSSEKGATVRDILTGDKTEAESTSVVINDPGTVVTMSQGLGRTVQPMSPGEMRGIMADTAPLKSVKHKTTVNPNSTTFVISPKKRDGGDTDK